MDSKTMIKLIVATLFMFGGMFILQPYGLLFFGVACMIISFLIINSCDDSEFVDWNKISRDSDDKFNQQKFEHMNQRIDRIEKLAVSNL
jgi:hypothetical protein